MTTDFNIDIWHKTLIDLQFECHSIIEESETNFEIQKWKSKISTTQIEPYPLRYYIEIFLKNKRINKILIFENGENYPESKLITTTHFILQNFKYFRNSQINTILHKN